MAEIDKRKPKQLILVFEVLSILSKILFIPVLIFTILTVGIVIDSKPLNNIENGIELPQYKAQESVKAGWGYYMIPIVESSSVETVYYAKKTNAENIQAGTIVVFYDVVDFDAQPFEYKINVKEIREVVEEDGKIYYEVYSESRAIPYQNIIGEVIQEIPVYLSFFIKNVNTIEHLIFFGILPLAVILSVFIINSVIYAKTKQIKNAKTQMLSKAEQENMEHFEQLKKMYSSPKEEELNGKATFEKADLETVQPEPQMKDAPIKVQIPVKPPTPKPAPPKAPAPKPPIPARPVPKRSLPKPPVPKPPAQKPPMP